MDRQIVLNDAFLKTTPRVAVDEKRALALRRSLFGVGVGAWVVH
jgi:hypothetical protein